MAYVDESGLEYYSTLVKKDIDTKASIDSPALTGTPTAPTPEDSTNESQIATVGYVGSNIDTVNTAVENAQNTADSAMSAASTAQSSADTALDTANTANTTATSANSTARDALDTINDAYAIAESAQKTANEALSAASGSGGSADSAINMAEEAISIANSALDSITQAVEDANNALITASENSDRIDQLRSSIVTSYDIVGSVDLDEYTSVARIYASTGSTNTPTEDEDYFVEVSVTEDDSVVRQMATGATSGRLYVRDTRQESVVSLGILTIEGNLACDLNVIGNVVVNGLISGTVNATGDVSYYELSGTVNANVDLDSYDISVYNNMLTIDGDLTSNNGDLYTTGSFNNSNGAITTINKNLTIENDSDVAITNNNSDFTINEGITVNVSTSYYSSSNVGGRAFQAYEGSTTTIAGILNAEADGYNCYGVQNTDSTFTIKTTGSVTSSGGLRGTSNNGGGVFVVNGTLTTTGTADDGIGLYLTSDIVVNGTANAYSDKGSAITCDGAEVTGSGKVYANGTLYYEGDGTPPVDDDPDDGDNDGDGDEDTTWMDWSDAGKLSGTVGNDRTFVWLNKGDIVASVITAGSEDTPVYVSSGSIWPAGHSFSEYMPLSGGTFTGGIFGKTIAVDDNEIDLSKGNVFSLELIGDVELSFTGIPEDTAACFSLVVAGEGEITWPENITWNGNTEPAFKEDSTIVITFLTPDGGKVWYGSIIVGDEEESDNGPGLSGTVGSDTVPVYLNDGEITALSGTVGSTLKPVYLNEGEVTELSGTVGSSVKPIYLNEGELVEVDGTVGSDTKAIYFNEGEITEIDSTIGSGTKLMYLDEGNFTESDSSVGSGVKPVYLEDGEIVESDGNVGDETHPIYLEDGELKESSESFSDYMLLSGGTITGDIEIADDVKITSVEDSEGININGVIITAEGHIKLPSGVEFY